MNGASKPGKWGYQWSCVFQPLWESGLSEEDWAAAFMIRITLRRIAAA